MQGNSAAVALPKPCKDMVSLLLFRNWSDSVKISNIKQQCTVANYTKTMKLLNFLNAVVTALVSFEVMIACV